MFASSSTAHRRRSLTAPWFLRRACVPLLAALLGASASVMATNPVLQCLVEKRCVEYTPDVSDRQRTDAKGYTYMTCHNVVGRNFPCK